MLNFEPETPFTADERFEIEAESYFSALKCLKDAERAARPSGVTRATIAKKSGIHPSTVSKVLGGHRRNITLNTLFLLLRSMNRKADISSRNTLHIVKKHNICIDDIWAGSEIVKIKESQIVISRTKARRRINLYRGRAA